MRHWKVTKTLQWRSRRSVFRQFEGHTHAMERILYSRDHHQMSLLMVVIKKYFIFGVQTLISNMFWMHTVQ